jgi:hypothetical protein
MQLAVLLLNFRFELPSASKPLENSSVQIQPTVNVQQTQEVTCQNKLFRRSEKLSPLKAAYICCWGTQVLHIVKKAVSSILREATPFEGCQTDSNAWT